VLGYICCDEGELLVKHHKLYGAAYCGLCHSVRKNKLRPLLPFFSYDFVFLAIARLLFTGEEMTLEKDFCLFHPFRRKKKRLKDNRALSYSAYAAALLTAEKMKDDCLDRDSSFFRRVLIWCYLPFLRSGLRKQERKNPSYRKLSQKVRELLKEGRDLEQKGADLDTICANFGQVLAYLMSFDTEGKANRLLFGLGDLLGKYIYTLDALDDAAKDLRSGAFNPLLKKGALPEKKELILLDQVQAFYISEMKKILDLSQGEEALFRLCENIIEKGLPGQMKKILQKEFGEKP
jgi:hypothetical protein